jgi:hypothetical protein
LAEAALPVLVVSSFRARNRIRHAGKTPVESP